MLCMGGRCLSNDIMGGTVGKVDWFLFSSFFCIPFVFKEGRVVLFWCASSCGFSCVFYYACLFVFLHLLLLFLSSCLPRILLPPPFIFYHFFCMKQPYHFIFAFFSSCTVCLCALSCFVVNGRNLFTKSGLIFDPTAHAAVFFVCPLAFSSFSVSLSFCLDIFLYTSL